MFVQKGKINTQHTDVDSTVQLFATIMIVTLAFVCMTVKLLFRYDIGVVENTLQINPSVLGEATEIGWLFKLPVRSYTPSTTSVQPSTRE